MLFLELLLPHSIRILSKNIIRFQDKSLRKYPNGNMSKKNILPIFKIIRLFCTSSFGHVARLWPWFRARGT